MTIDGRPLGDIVRDKEEANRRPQVVMHYQDDERLIPDGQIARGWFKHLRTIKRMAQQPDFPPEFNINGRSHRKQRHVSAYERSRVTGQQLTRSDYAVMDGLEPNAYDVVPKERRPSPYLDIARAVRAANREAEKASTESEAAPVA
jgi:hypothetical protein